MGRTVARGLFITGTDTGVGKTVVAVALLRGLAREHVLAVGMKPVAAGLDAGAVVNADVLALAAASGVDAPLADRNPYAFADPIAPHIAARRAHATISLEAIRAAHARLAGHAAAVIVEGAGGALVPLDDRSDMLDIARALALPVLLVVGVRLGCLNLARLSALAIRSRGLRLAGWAASRIDPAMAFADESVSWLREELGAPCVADYRDASPPAADADALDALGLLGVERIRVH